MKIKIAQILFWILIGTCVWGHHIFAKETPDELKELYAQAAVLMDADSGRVLFGKNEDIVLPMASTTKIMTCILALENMGQNQKTIASENAVRQPKVHLGVTEGESFYVKDLLYSLMLESHNDSAVMIAEAIAGSEEAFSLMMNEKAEELGCTDTYFITSNGLDAEDEYGVHSTTAKDLALIMRYCIGESEEKDAFLKITGTDQYHFSNIEKTKTYTCNNHNAFLKMMNGAISGKTGFTNDAGYCYVAALKRDGKTFIVVLLACGWPNHKNYKWEDTRKLMEYGLENYNYQNIYQEWSEREIKVKNGVEKQAVLVGIRTREPQLEVLLHEEDEVILEELIPKYVQAPVYEGDSIGQILYVLNGDNIKLYEIVSLENVSERNIWWCITQILNRYFV